MLRLRDERSVRHQRDDQQERGSRGPRPQRPADAQPEDDEYQSQNDGDENCHRPLTRTHEGPPIQVSDGVFVGFDALSGIDLLKQAGDGVRTCAGGVGITALPTESDAVEVAGDAAVRRTGCDENRQ